MSGNPKFVTAGGMATSMQLEPPFDFDGVTLRVFPLRASLHQMQRFVDQYVNIVPPQVGRFRVPMPFAYLMFINYGKMSVDAANLGWISQQEILFCIPMEWYQRVDDRYVFKDWAFLSPFIYVDNELSMTTGREVYGWPKSIATLNPVLNAWLDDPRADPHLATAATNLFASAYAGQRQAPKVFLEVIQKSAPSPTQVPMDMRGPGAPWVSLSNAIQSAASLSSDWADILQGMGVTRRQPYLDREAYAAMAKQAARIVNPYDPALVFNTINLKQFRSADKPNLACYQALTNARMAMRGFRSGGLLGDASLLLGDVSGGFRVNLHRYAATPVIEALGLEVESEWQGEHARVASLKPVLPYWLDVDMRYERGETLAWRTKASRGWTVGTGEGKKKFVKSDRAPGAPAEFNRYNTTTGGASQEIAGPFEFPDTTLRVLPLLADEAKLKKLVDDYLSKALEPEQMRFEPWGRYVYLVIANHEGVSSDTNNIGWWADRDVTFYVPVRWYHVKEGADGRAESSLQSLALIPIFSYANSTTAAITASEVSGAPTLKACIDCPNGSWLDKAGPGDTTTRPYLSMSATVLPVLGEGQGAEQRVLLEVRDGMVLPNNDEPAWRRVAEHWGSSLRADLKDTWKKRREHSGEFDKALSLSLEVLGNGLPVNVLTLKQFRDAAQPDEACYQSLVMIRKEIEYIHDLREMEGRIYARIHDYPTQPIVEALGLMPKRTDYDGAARVHYLEPVRPFWMRVSMREQLGVTVRRRAGSPQWKKDPVTKDMNYPYYFHHGKVGVSGELGEKVYPQRLKAQVKGVIPPGIPPGTKEVGAAPPRSHTEDANANASARARAAKAVEAVNPQMIIGAILSREWENWGTPRWSIEHESITRGMNEATRKELPGDVPTRQTEYLRQRIERCNHAETLPSGEKLVPRTSRRRELYASLTVEAQRLTRLAQREENAPIRNVIAEVVFLSLDDKLYTAASRALKKYPAEIRSAEDNRSVQADFKAMGKEIEEFIQEHTKPNAIPLESYIPPKLLDGRTITRLMQEVRPRVQLLLEVVQTLSREVRDRLHNVVIEDVRRKYDRYLAALVHELSLAAQKPDHCIRAETLETRERDFVLPRDQCWEGDGARWFVGPSERGWATRPVLVSLDSTVGDLTECMFTDTFDDAPDAEMLGSIRSITVWHGEIVDAIQVAYHARPLAKHGGAGGTPTEVHFDAADPLVEVKGSYGRWYDGEHVYALRFITRSGATSRPPGSDKTYGSNNTFGSGVRCENVGHFALHPKPEDRERCEIGALLGGSYLHTDGTEALSGLAATLIGPPSLKVLPVLERSPKDAEE